MELPRKTISPGSTGMMLNRVTFCSQYSLRGDAETADGRVAASRSMDAVNMPAGLIILNIDMVLMKVWYGVLSILPLETCIYVKSQSHGLRSPVATLSRNVRRRIL